MLCDSSHWCECDSLPYACIASIDMETLNSIIMEHLVEHLLYLCCSGSACMVKATEKSRRKTRTYFHTSWFSLKDLLANSNNFPKIQNWWLKNVILSNNFLRRKKGQRRHQNRRHLERFWHLERGRRARVSYGRHCLLTLMPRHMHTKYATCLGSPSFPQQTQ